VGQISVAEQVDSSCGWAQSGDAQFPDVCGVDTVPVRKCDRNGMASDTYISENVGMS
jgi:hypothetical protein